MYMFEQDVGVIRGKSPELSGFTPCSLFQNKNCYNSLTIKHICMISRPLCRTQLEEHRNIILKKNSRIIILRGEYFLPHTPKEPF